MREILFRGKRADNGEWVYGDYFRDKGDFIKVLPNAASTRTYLVCEDSVGQFTGQRDCTGVAVFEDDIVYVPSEDEYAIVFWDSNTSRFILEFDGWISDFDHFYGYECNITGNTFDDKEESTSLVI